MEVREPPSWRYLIAWYATSVCLLMLLPAWKFGLPVWRLPRSLWLPFACLATAFAVSAGIAALLRPANRWRAVWLMTVSTIANFGVVFFGFIVTRTVFFSRAVTIATILCAVVLIPVPYVVRVSRMYRAMAFGALLAAVAVLPLQPRYRRCRCKTRPQSRQSTTISTPRLIRELFRNLWCTAERWRASAIVICGRLGTVISPSSAGRRTEQFR